MFSLPDLLFFLSRCFCPHRYVIKTFNFYIFPKPFNRTSPDTKFICQVRKPLVCLLLSGWYKHFLLVRRQPASLAVWGGF